MIRSRAAAVSAAALCLVAIGPAEAAPSCRVIDDEAADAYLVQPLGGSPAAGHPEAAVLDLRSVEVSAGRGSLRVVIAVGAGSTSSADSLRWSLRLSNGETAWSVSAYRHVDGDAFSAFGPAPVTDGAVGNLPYAGPGTGRIDVERGRVEVEVPLSVLRMPADARLDSFRAATARTVGSSTGTGPQSTSSHAADEASSRTRTRLDRGCARAG